MEWVIIGVAVLFVVMVVANVISWVSKVSRIARQIPPQAQVAGYAEQVKKMRAEGANRLAQRQYLLAQGVDPHMADGLLDAVDKGEL